MINSNITKVLELRKTLFEIYKDTSKDNEALLSFRAYVQYWLDANRIAGLLKTNVEETLLKPSYKNDNIHKSLGLLDDIFFKELAVVKSMLKPIGGPLFNSNSATFVLLMNYLHYFDIQFDYIEQEQLALVSNMVLADLQTCVDKGISQHWFDNFTDKVYSCNSYSAVMSLINTTIENGINYRRR